MKAGLSGNPSRREKNGKEYWVQNYKDEEGKRKQATGATASEAITKAENRVKLSTNSEVKRIAKGEKNLPKSEKMTVGEFVDLYIDLSEKGRDGDTPLVESTIKAYRNYANNWVKPVLGNIKLTKLTRKHVEDFRDELLYKGKNRVTINKALNQLNMALNYAVKAELIPSNPGHGIRVQIDWSEIQDQYEDRIPSHEDMRQLEETAKLCYRSEEYNIHLAYRRYYPLFLLLRTTGMRFSECIGLQWDDFDDAMTMVKIRRRVSVPKKGMPQEDRIGRNKSKNSRRDVPVPEQVVPVLKRWKETCPETEKGWVFPTKNGNPINYSNAHDKFWLPLIKRAGIAHFSMHGLRHYYASVLIRKGHIKYASLNLGHSSVSFTMDVYSHLIPKDEEMMDAVRHTVLDGMDV
ncbi:integrase [Ruegeria phage RpAliso]|nr:integrase [Ruegeria phage RpAliso]